MAPRWSDGRRRPPALLGAERLSVPDGPRQCSSKGGPIIPPSAPPGAPSPCTAREGKRGNDAPASIRMGPAEPCQNRSHGDRKVIGRPESTPLPILRHRRTGDHFENARARAGGGVVRQLVESEESVRDDFAVRLRLAELAKI